MEHGGIDGYSRVVTYLKAATNNSSSRALSAFLQGIDSYGLPSRVFADQGGVNVLIAEYMVQKKGQVKGASSWAVAYTTSVLKDSGGTCLLVVSVTFTSA